ncbi:phage tail protein [Georgenia sp. 311]|uniref:Phage tail protein n=1 Tax=Georgenia wutianyii TaxID=2585135 RepID=A0ABX5VNJ4_9MICO|nr:MULTISPECIES: phage tail protein [Georgenia]QDB79386.1 phage tail protein [Georgenia wutianyii]TNC19561.1 phage tail protein [Georgenia sp. 311]
MATRTNDPLVSFNFKVEIEGITVGDFAEVTGLGSTIESIDYREGGENTTVRKLPGKTTYSDIVLKRGTTKGDNTLYDWHREVVSGVVTLRSGSIIVTDRQGTEVLRYNFINAWPKEFKPADYNATASSVATESVTFAHEGLEIG